MEEQRYELNKWYHYGETASYAITDSMCGTWYVVALYRERWDDDLENTLPAVYGPYETYEGACDSMDRKLKLWGEDDV